MYFNWIQPQNEAVFQIYAHTMQTFVCTGVWKKATWSWPELVKHADFWKAIANLCICCTLIILTRSDHKENVNLKPIIFQCLILYKFYITHMFWVFKLNFGPSGHLFYHASQETAGRHYPSKNFQVISVIRSLQLRTVK